MFYIYKITNLINGKTYIGQHEYKKLNDNYMGKGVHLRRAQKKYGIENFKKDILVFNISERKHADLLEKTFIAAEREKVGRENCYNEADGGQGGNLGPEVCKKIAEKLKGHPVSEETRKKIAESHKGRKQSEETKKKKAKSLKGRVPGMLGKHHSDESRKKSAETHKGMHYNMVKKHWKLVDGKRVWY